MKKILCVFLILVCLSFAGCSKTDMDSDELTVKGIIYYSDAGIEHIKYVDLLEKANNGYYDYYYYDVVTESGQSFIVEIKDYGNRLEYNDFKNEYDGYFMKKDYLGDMIEYRASEFGSSSDREECGY